MGADRNILNFGSRSGNPGTRTTSSAVLTSTNRQVILEAITDFEISILAALWNHKDRAIGIAYVYLYANAPMGSPLTPYAIALNSLIERGLVCELTAPRFEYRLSRDGIWAIMSLVTSGKGDKFEACLNTTRSHGGQCKEGAGETASQSAPENTGVAQLVEQSAYNRPGEGSTPAASTNSPYDPRPSIVRKSEEVHMDFCFTDCGRIASGKCECGNPVCNAHRYDSNGNHNPYGMCSKCLDEITAVMDTGVEMVRNIGGRQ